MTFRRGSGRPRLLLSLLFLGGVCALKKRFTSQDVADSTAQLPATRPEFATVLQGHGYKSATRVLLLGCSIDRNAVEYFCQSLSRNAIDRGELTPRIRNMSEILEARWCRDPELNINVASLFHPGVGYNGDLQAPFFFRWTPHGLNDVRYSPSTAEILDSIAYPTAKYLLHGPPHLVVVDSSLWDLSAWHTVGAQDHSPQRVRRWCDHDLPSLLRNVSAAFPNSSVAFRTAPPFSGQRQDWPWFSLTAQDVRDLYDCVQNRTENGKLYGKYSVIDYRNLVISLKKRKMREIFMHDGMHPHALPSLLYVNEVLKMANATPPKVDEDADLAHLFALESRKEQGPHASN